MTDQSNQSNHMPYEGAGFLFTYRGNVLLGNRIKKPQDLAKDPTPEVEYFGGKPEPSDCNDPLVTAICELIEEVGQPILDKDWGQRIIPIHIFQPISQKWIWCSKLELNDREYSRFVQADRDLDHWNPETKRDYSHMTDRKALVSKAVNKFVAVSLKELCNYITNFSQNVEKSKNRMNDAKEYRKNHTLNVVRISNDQDKDSVGLRAFNIVIFEEHVKVISGEQ